MSSDPSVEIFKNLPGDGSVEWEDTFYGYLSEHGEWDVEKFWVLHKALILLGRSVQKDLTVDRSLAHALLYIQQHVLTHVASHSDPRVDWKIESLNDDQLYEYTERFELAILGAISGELLPESSFDLVNPLLSNV